ncbi:M24 family metallopeptidase [Winogradskyella maritima]|nr:M24 family metallopeptidase [Winogradskyella maritima]
MGAEYHGYTADVTRTIPANGKFSKEQKLIYEIVYEAQEAGIKASVVGAPFQAPGQAASKVVTAGLMKLGIIKKEDSRIYFPHGTSHYLGLDVHDRGTYGAFQPNTVITVEPGIYIPEGSDCDKKWWGIAVRIEDDILITEKRTGEPIGRHPEPLPILKKPWPCPAPWMILNCGVGLGG